MLERLFSGENARSAKAVFAGQQLIELKAEAVKWGLPPIVVGNDKREIVHDVGRVLQEQTALFERFHDQADVPLLEVAHSAVGQLGAAAGGTFAEIALLEEQHVIAARSRIDVDAHAGRSSAYDDHVPGLGMRYEAVPHFVASHQCSLCCRAE